MNEREFGLKIRQRLNAAVHDLPPNAADRLMRARQQALARHNPTIHILSLAAVGRFFDHHIAPRARIWTAALVLGLCAAAGGYYSELQRANELEEVDSALLADELPIDAYLDRGFDTWLKHETQD